MELAICNFKPISTGQSQKLILLAQWKKYWKIFFFNHRKQTVPNEESHRIGSPKENRSLTSNKLSSGRRKIPQHVPSTQSLLVRISTPYNNLSVLISQKISNLLLRNQEE